MNPTVSVIMPTFRRGNNGYLNRAITSVLMQTYRDFEFIIMDDGSADNTQNVIKSFPDRRIRNFRHEVNGGLHSKRLNEGISLSKGKYISFMFDDDYWLPHHLGTLVSKLEELPVLSGMVFAFTLSVHAQTREIRLLGAEYSPENLMNGNCIGNQSVLIRKDVLHDVGGYDEDPVIIRLCDWDLWRRIIQKGYQICAIPLVTSINEYALPDSLQETVPLDLSLIRGRMAMERLEYLRNLIKPEQLQHLPREIPNEAPQLIKSVNNPAVYVVRNGLKYLIPSEDIFLQAHFRWENVAIVSQTQVDLIPDGGVFSE